MSKKPRGGDLPDQSPSTSIPVVGIGASAGGIGALEALLPLFKEGSGVAFVIVQHLDPTHESILPGLLDRAAELPVVEATDRAAIDRDHIYVIPPNKTLTILDSHLQLGPVVQQRGGQRTPIDLFFRRWPAPRASWPPASSSPAPAATERSGCAPSRRRAVSPSPRKAPSTTA
jgi:chemotaxis response regulator CheB